MYNLRAYNMAKITHIFLGLVLVLLGCTNHYENLPSIMKPEDYVKTNPLKPSQIPIQISVSENKLIKLANDNDEVFNVEGEVNNAGASYLYEIKKRGDISLRNDGQRFFFTLPLEVKFTAKGGLINNLLRLKAVDGAIDLHLSIQPVITSDWQLKTNTVLEDYDWIEKPEMSVFGRSVDLTWLTNSMISSLKDRMTAMVDGQIAKSDMLRKNAENAWNLLQTSMPEVPNTQVKTILRPTDLLATPIKMRDTTIYMDVEVVGKIIFSSDDTGLHSKVTKLPPLQVKPYLNDAADIKVYVFLGYDEISRNLEKYIVGQTYTVSNRSFTVEDIKLYPGGDNIIVELELSGAMKGKIYLDGRPTYDPKTGMFRIEDVKYNVDTKNVLLKSAEWMMRSTILKQIEQRSSINLNDKIQEYLDALNENLERYELPYGVVAHAHADAVKVEDVSVDKDGVHIRVNAHGEISLAY